MSIIAVKCTQCGANIKIDDNKKNNVCQYCGASYINEEKGISEANLDEFISAVELRKKQKQEAKAEETAGKTGGRGKPYAEQNAAASGKKAGTSKKRKKVLLITIPVICAMLIAAGILIGLLMPKTTAEDGLLFKPYSGGYMITRADKEDDKENVVIPSEYKGKPVVKINGSAFSNNDDIETVTIPASIKEIGDRAFYGCSDLKKVIFEDGANPVFGDGVFSNCENLEEVLLSSSMETLGVSMFSNTGLESIVIPESVKYLRQNAFSNCEELETVSHSRSLNIESGAFSGCGSLDKIYIISSSQQGNIAEEGNEDYIDAEKIYK